MTAVISYFISVLLFLPTYIGPEPNEGWLHLVYPFPEKEMCEQQVSENYEEIVRIFVKAAPVPVEIKEIACLRVEEIAKKNINLGHDPAPQNFNDDPPLSKPLTSTIINKSFVDCPASISTDNPFQCEKN